MVADDQASAPAKHLLMIPEDRLQGSLERTGSDTLLEGDGLDVLSLAIGKQSLNVGSQEVASLLAMKAIDEKGEKLDKQSAKRCDIMNRHRGDLPWLHFRNVRTRMVAFFRAQGRWQEILEC
jgi:hypothetical protein